MSDELKTEEIVLIGVMSLMKVEMISYLSAFQFDKELDLLHDIITTTHPQGKTDMVYSQFLKIIH